MPVVEAAPGVNPYQFKKNVAQAVAGPNPYDVLKNVEKKKTTEEKKSEMRFGALGDIIFMVSENCIRNIENIKWSGSARYQTHQRLAGHALLEFVGLDPDKISFDMHLMSDYGVDPVVEIAKLWTYERNHAALPLNIGLRAYGKYRWVITSHTVKVNFTDLLGKLTDVTVSIDLEEYLDA